VDLRSRMHLGEIHELSCCSPICRVTVPVRVCMIAGNSMIGPSDSRKRKVTGHAKRDLF
jgi:hypothetical protein